MPLQAKITNVSLGEDVTSKEITLRVLEGEPEHLRVLGQRITVSSPDKDVSFLVGPDVKKAYTYSVPAGADAPRITVIGSPDSTFALVYKGACKYKHS